MKQLTTIQNYIFAAGAVLMVIGVGCVVFRIMPDLTSIVFAIGAIAFAIIQMSQRYNGQDLTIRRLRKLMVIGDFCFIISALLCLEFEYKVLAPYFYSDLSQWEFYTQYIYNNWVIPLLIGAVIELYTTHRISYELNKIEH